jgi:hypothetical protein
MTADSTAQREKLRATHRVRLVKSHEEGFAAAEVPVGVYGFTSSAGLAAPLFAAQHYRNFEMHHLPNGEIAIVGFVAPEDARRLATATAPVTITIFPEIEGQATEIVAIATHKSCNTGNMLFATPNSLHPHHERTMKTSAYRLQ